MPHRGPAGAVTALTVCITLFAAWTALPRAQTPAPKVDLKDVLSRVVAYAEQYGDRLASVVAEERYWQQIDYRGSRTERPGAPPAPRQTLVSDYALLRLPDGKSWSGFRDTFEVDGRPVREREDRLLRLLADGSRDGIAQAERIATENARFNLGATVVVRNINVPTLVLELVERYRERFSFALAGREAVDDEPAWRLELRERETPTVIRRPNGADQPVRGFLWVDAASGAIRRTTLTWEKGPRGSITVTFGSIANVDVLVPLRMTERYDEATMTISGEASYSRYRRFETGARLIGP